MYVYVVDLEDGCVWVGYTDSMYRICSILNGTGSLPKWVQEHRALALVRMEPIPPDEDFRSYTNQVIEELRCKYGDDKVNGHVSSGVTTRHTSQRHRDGEMNSPAPPLRVPHTKCIPSASYRAEAQMTADDLKRLAEVASSDTSALTDLMKDL